MFSCNTFIVLRAHLYKHIACIFMWCVLKNTSRSINIWYHFRLQTCASRWYNRLFEPSNYYFMNGLCYEVPLDFAPNNIRRIPALINGTEQTLNVTGKGTIYKYGHGSLGLSAHFTKQVIWHLNIVVWCRSTWKVYLMYINQPVNQPINQYIIISTNHHPKLAITNLVKLSKFHLFPNFWSCDCFVISGRRCVARNSRDVVLEWRICCHDVRRKSHHRTWKTTDGLLRNGR